VQSAYLGTRALRLALEPWAWFLRTADKLDILGTAGADYRTPIKLLAAVKSARISKHPRDYNKGGRWPL
jgi:hypothetical protein